MLKPPANAITPDKGARNPASGLIANTLGQIRQTASKSRCSFLTFATQLLKCGQLSVFHRCPRMKNVYEVLRQKELELARLEKEVEALRVAAPLLSDDKEMSTDAGNNKPTLASTSPQQPIRIPQPAVNASPQPARAAGWEDTAKRWP
jgi:hypothetical protein